MQARHDMVTVFVVRRDEHGRSHEFLQLYRAQGSYMAQTWQIVRGGVERGESYVSAAIRELREETGLAPTEFYRLGTVESFYTAIDDTLWHSVAFCALVGREQPVVLNQEHTDFRWVSRDRIEKCTMWSSELELFRDVCRTILDDGAGKAFLWIDSRA
ncbi:MAG TPA: NUDIX domain-containing protein [Polyangiaceae bacterium]|jgi:dATP pyrophosphohydrolase